MEFDLTLEVRINKKISTSFVPCSEPKLTNRVLLADAKIFCESNGVINKGSKISTGPLYYSIVGTVIIKSKITAVPTPYYL